MSKRRAEILEINDTPYSAARKLAECEDSSVREKVKRLLMDVVDQVDHSGDSYGALGFMFDIDRNGYLPEQILKIYNECEQDLQKFAIRIQPQRLKPPVSQAATALTREQLLQTLIDLIEKKAEAENSFELMEIADSLAGGTPVQKTPEIKALLKEALKAHKVSDNYLKINDLVFGS
ncbi:MAG: hypothetical protein SFV17_05320 [Candidatus Obscuribacter sp.]|nr:hypothetical protein [Candidatus Obscuribacter sp.]